MFVAVELIKFIRFIELAQVDLASVSKQVLVHNLHIEISFLLCSVSCKSNLEMAYFELMIERPYHQFYIIIYNHPYNIFI